MNVSTGANRSLSSGAWFIAVSAAVFSGASPTNLSRFYGRCDNMAGYRNVWTPYAEMNHHESASRGYEDNPEKQARFAGEVRLMQQRWGEELLHDPAYSPNLTRDSEDFAIAWPPRVSQI